jgi:alpha-tubulin suppressor-like RCC1 family protein
MGKKRRILLVALLVAAIVAVVLRIVQNRAGSHGQAIIAPNGSLVVLKGDGSLWAMGQWILDNGFLESHSRLDQFDEGRDWVAVASGAAHCLALKSDGSLWAWGSNDYGELGGGTNQLHRSHPVRIGHDNDWAKIFAGGMRSFALKSNGTLWAWGMNNKGQLGLGSTLDANVPAPVGQDHDWATVAPGLVHTLALKSDGSLWAWGQNGNGMLGDGTAGLKSGAEFDAANKSSPVRIGTSKDWQAISAGHNHSAGIKTDGSLWTWGGNFNGQLGNGTQEFKAIPSRLGLANDWKLVAVGANHTVALKRDGTLWAWGANFDNQVGNGTNIDQLVPVQIGQATNWVWASGGVSYSVGLKADATLWFWGEKLVPSEDKKMVWVRRMLNKFKIPIHLKPFQSTFATPVQIDDWGALRPSQFPQIRTNALEGR